MLNYFLGFTVCFYWYLIIIEPEFTDSDNREQQLRLKTITGQQWTIIQAIMINNEFHIPHTHSFQSSYTQVSRHSSVCTEQFWWRFSKPIRIATAGAMLCSWVLIQQEKKTFFCVVRSQCREEYSRDQICLRLKEHDLYEAWVGTKPNLMVLYGLQNHKLGPTVTK